jgi:ABC-type polysaccharide/polyol phosphate export permease
MFYSSGVFFTFESILGQKHGQVLVDVLLANPFATLLAEARHVLISSSWESPVDAFSTPWLVLVPCGVIAASLVVGYLVFQAEAPKVAEDL